jgi:hypothetical protein
MKKMVLVIVGIALLSSAAMAQRGNNRLSVAADLSAPTGDFGEYSKMGFGGTVKALYGIGKSGQITLTSGYTSISAKEIFKQLLGADKITQSIIPVLAGYRHNIKGFYVEPQVGYGLYASKIKGGMLDSKDSGGAITWAAGVGYVYRSFELGARYQSGHKDGESNGLVGVRLGYNFSL